MSALLDDMHWDLMMPPLEKKKEIEMRFKKKIYVLQLNEIHTLILCIAFVLRHLEKSLLKKGGGGR